MSLQSRSAKWYLDPVAGNQLDIGRLGTDSRGVGGHVVNMCLGEVTAGRTPESGTCSGRDGFKTVNRRPGSDQLRAAVSRIGQCCPLRGLGCYCRPVRGQRGHHRALRHVKQWGCSSTRVRASFSRAVPAQLPPCSARLPCTSRPHRIRDSDTHAGTGVHSTSISVVSVLLVAFFVEFSRSALSSALHQSAAPCFLQDGGGGSVGSS